VVSENIPIEDRTYAVMTDSRKHGSRTVLARKSPQCSRESGFWTGYTPEDIWEMDRATAEDVLAKLGYNNPRIVRYEKAISLIAAQRDARLERARENDRVPDHDTAAPGM
jgi:hypothetical protein